MTWLERPQRILRWLAILWFGIVVITFSDAGVPYPTWVTVVLAGIGVTLWWLIQFSLSDIEGRGDKRPWLVTFGILAAGFVLAATMPLLCIRVYLSASALRESSPQLAAVSPSDLYQNGRWVGLFQVREFSQFGSELRFITNECGLVDTCGIVFAPDGPPRNRDEDSFSHLFGPWWHWYQSW